MANSNHFLSVLSSIGLVMLISLFYGLLTVAIGEFFLMIREIALNTRVNSIFPQGEYGTLLFVSGCIVGSGWLTVIIGCVFSLWLFLSNRNIGESLVYFNQFLYQNFNHTL